MSWLSAALGSNPLGLALGVGGMLLGGDSQEDAQHAAYQQRQQGMLPGATRSNLFGPAGLGGLMQRPTESRYDPNLFGASRDIVNQSLLQRTSPGLNLPETRYLDAPAVQATPTPAPVAQGFFGSGAAGDTYQKLLSGELTVDPEFSPLLGAVEKDVLRQFETGKFGAASEPMVAAIRKAGIENVKLAYDKALEASIDEQARRNILGGTQGRQEMFDKAVGPRAAALATIESDIAQLEFKNEQLGKEMAYETAINVGKYQTDLATKLAENELSRKWLIAQELRKDELAEKVRLQEMTYEEAQRVSKAQHKQDLDQMLYNMERSDKAEDRQLAEELRIIEEDKQAFDQQLTMATSIYNQALQMDEADLNTYVNTIWRVLNAFTGQGSVINAQASQLAGQGKDTMSLFRDAYEMGQAFMSGNDNSSSTSTNYSGSNQRFNEGMGTNAPQQTQF